MRNRWLIILSLGLACLGAPAGEDPAPLPAAAGARKVVILPLRGEIAPPLVYIARRVVKQAMELHADLLVVAVDTNGGRGDSMLEIIECLNKFPGKTVAFVDPKAFSAGALICFAAQQIFMVPGSVIGAAAPVTLSPTGGGIEALPDTVEVKTASAISALMRVNAERNGHNPELVNAMVKKTGELVMDGKVINHKGDILTLTDTEAAATYGTPPKPLLSAGTVASLDALLGKLGYAEAERLDIQPTGAERLATWINALNWLWLMIGIGAIYLEYKLGGFGLVAIVGLCAFALYFLGSYVAGLSGLEWPALFLLGLILVALELLVFPGTVALGLTGAVLMLVTLIMAMVDMYPGMPALPTLPQLVLPLRSLAYALVGSIVLIAVLGRLLPRTPWYGVLVTQGASGVVATAAEARLQSGRVGCEGVALSILRPGGKAQFGEDVLDVVTQGDLVPAGRKVRIIAFSGGDAIVEAVPS
jgi:membrane-bound serine protease (ClpP class)